MKDSPFVGITLAFITGILIAEYLTIPFIICWIIALLALILSIVSLKSNTKFLISFFISIIFLGAAAAKDSQALPPNHISRLIPYKDSIRIEGVIDSDPIIKKRSTSFVFKIERLIQDKEAVSVCGKVLVNVFRDKTFLYGDRLLLEGVLYRVPYFRISRRLNYRDYLRQNHIYSVFCVGKRSAVKILERDNGSPLKTLALRIKDRIAKIIANNMSNFSANILSALILGERSNISDNLRDVMVQSGTVHIIAISGLHVGLVAFVILMILKMLRLPKKACYVIITFFLIIYCLLTGAKPPVIRATIMAVILFWGYIIGRQTDVYNTLSLAALTILSFNPQTLFNISFQLSFGSIISIVGLAPKIKSLFTLLPKGDSTGPARPLGHILKGLLSTSLAAWIGLLPLVAYYFNIVSPVAVLANMVVVPYLTIVVGSGLLFILTGFAYPPLASILSQASEATIIFLFKFISLSIAIPGAYFYTPNISVYWVIGYYLCLIAAIKAMDKLTFYC